MERIDQGGCRRGWYARRLTLACSAWAIALTALGCSKAQFDVAPVHGKVTIDGQPLPGGKVMFAPLAKGNSFEAGKTAMGRIANDGTFKLTTYSDGDGAVVGDHWVTIFGPSSDTSAGLAFGRLVVPQKKTVAADQENNVEIQLTRQDVVRLATK